MIDQLERIFAATVWGSFAEIIGAIGTLAAVVVAIALWRGDVHAKRRTQAEQVYLQRAEGRDGEYKISVVNDSDRPVRYVQLVMRLRKDWQRVFSEKYGASFNPEIHAQPPNGIVELYIKGAELLAANGKLMKSFPILGHQMLYRTTLSYVDAHGNDWHQAIRSDETFRWKTRRYSNRELRATEQGRKYLEEKSTPPLKIDPSQSSTN